MKCNDSILGADHSHFLISILLGFCMVQTQASGYYDEVASDETKQQRGETVAKIDVFLRSRCYPSSAPHAPHHLI